MTPERPSAGATVRQDNRWKSVIRVFAVISAILGLVLIANEIFENVTSCNAGACIRIHLSTMLWGLALLSLGLLILQKGDVSTSLQEFTATGTIVRGWWAGRRIGDKINAPSAVVRPIVTDHDDGVG